ncbi:MULTISPECIES: hypothetical protein [Vibrio]|uniref:hypothetical protein n=1 Tax=Vibrio TaxID=662 RepID=UPI0009321D24|nr:MULTISPECIES: hypothetical protein [Vibrio]
MLAWLATVFLLVGLGIKLAVSSRWVIGVLSGLTLLSWFVWFDIRLVCLGLFIAAPFLVRLSNQHTATLCFLLCVMGSTLGSLLITLLAVHSI